MDFEQTFRILIIDDNSAIHDDFKKILVAEEESEFDKASKALFGNENEINFQNFEIFSAYQGEEGVKLIEQGLSEQKPYALAFVDIRMPPGIDGVETVQKIREIDKDIQIVLCTAYSDYSFHDISKKLDNYDYLILKKPFDAIEIRQFSHALTKKWRLKKQVEKQLIDLQSLTGHLNNVASLMQATLESTQDGIIAVSLNQEVLIYNQNFLKLWDITDTRLLNEKSSVLFQQLAEHVIDSFLFLKMISSLTTQPKTQNHVEWRLKSGKILEFYAHSQYLDNEVIGVVYSFQDITSRKQLEEQLIHQANHDTLTGLPNRLLLFDRIQQAIVNAKRFNLNVGIFLIDLDNFKEVNDTLGHRAGDLLLEFSAKQIHELTREIDTVARLGGDEFVVVIASQSNEENFLSIANKYLEIFAKPCQIMNHEVTVTASIGISIYPQDGETPEILLKNADAALYYQKEIGRNGIQFFRSEFNKTVLQRSEIIIALRQAMQRNELFLNYQPLLDLKSETIIGFEALIRWIHPELGEIPPSQFIPLAEKIGVINEIGEWVLKTACMQVKIWQETSAFKKLRLSVNISERQFRHKDFVAMVRRVLADTKFDAGSLELEITENLITENATEVVEKMLVLKELGVHFAIDDFGTGYSTLNYLKHFPFDKIKIDKSFIANLGNDRSNANIVEAIIGMTKNMGIEVLAEGVENSNQVDFLKMHHSNQVQGYYFSKPLTSQACTDLLYTQKMADQTKE